MFLSFLLTSNFEFVTLKDKLIWQYKEFEICITHVQKSWSHSVPYGRLQQSHLPAIPFIRLINYLPCVKWALSEWAMTPPPLTTVFLQQSIMSHIMLYKNGILHHNDSISSMRKNRSSAHSNAFTQLKSVGCKYDGQMNKKSRLPYHRESSAQPLALPPHDESETDQRLKYAMYIFFSNFLFLAELARLVRKYLFCTNNSVSILGGSVIFRHIRSCNHLRYEYVTYEDIDHCSPIELSSSFYWCSPSLFILLTSFFILSPHLVWPM